MTEEVIVSACPIKKHAPLIGLGLLIVAGVVVTVKKVKKAKAKKLAKIEENPEV